MFADNMRRVADKLTKKFGNTITLVEIVQGDYNPNTGLVDEVETEHIVKCVISSFSSSDVLPDSTNVNDLVVMIYSDDFIINKSWNIKYDNKLWNIISISELSSQDKKIYYKLQIRSK